MLESLGKNPIAADIIIFGIIFCFTLIIVYCVYSLELPQPGNSSESKQHTFMLKKIEKKNIPIMPPDLVL